MKCPNCSLFNPDSAFLCDCGYNFKDSRQEKSRLKTQVSEKLLIDLIKIMSFFNPIAGLYLWSNHRDSKNFTLKPAMIAILIAMIYIFILMLSNKMR